MVLFTLSVFETLLFQGRLVLWSSNIVVIQAWYISSRVKLTFSGLGLEGSYQWWYKDTDHPELSWHSLAWDWEGVTSDEIKILLVLCLVMGITDSPSIQLHWKIFTILLFTSFSKTLLTTERRLTGQQFLAVDLSTTFLNTGTTDETFQQSEKQDSLRHLLKSQ